MDEPTESERDARKVRVGLAIITAVVLLAAVMAVLIDDPIGRTVMLVIVVVGVVRAFLLSRSLRRG